MTGMMRWLGSEFVPALAWALVDVLWQGLILAALLRFILVICVRPSLRYSWSFAALVAIAACPVVTLWLKLSGAPKAWTDEPYLTVLQFAAPVMPKSLSSVSIVMGDWPWMQSLVLVWIGGVTLLSIRAIGGWYVLDRLSRTMAMPLPGTSALIFERVKAQL